MENSLNKIIELLKNVNCKKCLLLFDDLKEVDLNYLIKFNQGYLELNSQNEQVEKFVIRTQKLTSNY